MNQAATPSASDLTGSDPSRADVVWLMVDGSRLVQAATRNGTIHRSKLYLQRLKQFFPDIPRVILVLTRADTSVVAENTIAQIVNEAAALGIQLSVQPISSFSTNPDVPAGAGISELILASMGMQAELYEFWPSTNIGESDRAIETIIRGGIEL